VRCHTRRTLARHTFGALAGAAGVVAAAYAPGGTPVPQTGPRRSAALHVVYPPTSDADLQIFKRFEEQHQGITINYDNAAIGHGDRLSEKLVTLVSGGTPPDVSIIHPSWSTSLLSKGSFLKLSDRMNKDRPLKADDILPYALEFYQWQGKQYAGDAAALVLVQPFARVTADR